MSMLLSKNNSMGRISFDEFKRQASFFLRDKIKTVRLNLTDATPAQLLTEEVTNGNPWSPDARTMSVISRAAFEVDDFWRIIDILHKRLMRFDERNWRMSYNTVTLLEHLLTHGPKSAVDEFQEDKEVIREMKNFQFIDSKGFNWGLRVQKLCEKVLNLLEDQQFIQEERTKVRKLSREIKGFGSFCHRPCSLDAKVDSASALKTTYERWNTHCYGYHDQENEFQNSNPNGFTEVVHVGSRANRHEDSEKFLVDKGEECSNGIMDHPFYDNQHQGSESLLSKKLV